MEINIKDYDYILPPERIAQYPVEKRDESKLLIFRKDIISEDIFMNIDEHLPSGSLLVFNNTRVIRARILFQKESGARIEILCLEPLLPSEYSLSFGSVSPVEWKCIVGNLKKWKSGKLSACFEYIGKKYQLKAEKVSIEGEVSRIRFSWDAPCSFAEVIELTGHIPLPPYINRNDELKDAESYQTVYSKINGSVAAPTAGLHFTTDVLERIKKRGILTAEVTLHVGAGTFQPVKSESIIDHEMHCEHFTVEATVIESLISKKGNVIPVGTTSVRTLESLYWIGVKIIQNLITEPDNITLGQWEVYKMPQNITLKDALTALLLFLGKENLNFLKASTSIIIVPGYKFRMTDGIITNFHQPRSTLLLLISAWTGERWKNLYSYALDNGFRFLSYGDSSLLLK